MVSETTSAIQTAAPSVSRGRAIYTLVILTLIYSLNYTDRNILGITLQSIKRELLLTDTQIGLISGFAFVLFYSVLGVPIARLADRRNRRNIIGIGFAFWSLMTALTGLVANVWQLAATRFLMGAGEATGIAPSNSMVSDLFPKNRALAIAILSSGSSIGFFLGYLIGGWVNQLYGWRAAFLVAGLPGLVIAALFALTVREAPRGGAGRIGAGLDAGTFRDALRFLWGSRTFVATVAGGSLMGINLYAVIVWNAAFLIRVHHLTTGQIGTSIGLTRGAIGLIGVFAGGWLAHRLGRRDPRWRSWVPAIGCALTFPADLLFLFGPSAALSVLGISLGSFMTGLHFGPVYSLCQDVARPRMRAVSTAIFLFCANLVGQIVGPLAVGYLNDTLRGQYGDMAIRYSMLVGAVCALLAGIVLATGAPSVARDMRRAET